MSAATTGAPKPILTHLFVFRDNSLASSVPVVEGDEVSNLGAGIFEVTRDPEGITDNDKMTLLHAYTPDDNVTYTAVWDPPTEVDEIIARPLEDDAKAFLKHKGQDMWFPKTPFRLPSNFNVSRFDSEEKTKEMFRCASDSVLEIRPETWKRVTDHPTTPNEFVVTSWTVGHNEEVVGVSIDPGKASRYEDGRWRGNGGAIGPTVGSTITRKELEAWPSEW